MTRAYGILSKPYSKKPLDGEGAYRFGGRWSSPGTRLAYTSEHLSLAILEYFVHIDSEDSPKDLVVATIEIPASVSRACVSVNRLPAGWRQSPAPPDLARFGDSFVEGGRTAILIVPSALAPAESNLHLNPLHQDFSKMRVASIEAFQYDSKFFG